MDFSEGVRLKLPLGPHSPGRVGVFHLTDHGWKYLPTTFEADKAVATATDFSIFAVLEAEVTKALPQTKINGYHVEPGTRIELASDVVGADVFYNTIGAEFPEEYQLYNAPLVMPDDLFEIWAMVAEPNKLPGEVKRFWYVTPQYVVVEVRNESGQPVSGVTVEFRIPGFEQEVTDERGVAAQKVRVDGLIAVPSLPDYFFQPEVQIGVPGDTLTFVALAGSESQQTFKHELSLNPAKISDPGRLNPFSSAVIREAMNRFLDRRYLAELALSEPSLTFLAPGTVEYSLLEDALKDLEGQYAYDKQAAEKSIYTEMEKMGAELLDGVWHYRGKELELIFLIRADDERKQIGDYIADELESIGFVVRRVYGNSQMTSLFLNSNPTDGLWHLYTGAWSGSAVFQNKLLWQFYTPAGMPHALWQAYDPPVELLDAAERLLNCKVDSLAEYADVFETGLRLAIQYSPRIWLMLSRMKNQ